ncbi:MAG: YihY/virulence factor BrkB family protein [Planctomycetota bacterium]|nr:YihY/virulence factor BrkB family protein [Planctomycetota bacterium]
MPDAPTTPPPASPTPPEPAVRALTVLKLLLLSAHRLNVPRMAAALSYRTLFSIIPILVVSLALFGAFSKEGDISRVVNQLLQFTGISEIVVEDPGTGEGPTKPSASPDPAATPGGASVPPPAAHSRARLDEFITGIVARVREVKFSAIAIVGLLALIYAAITLIVEMEDAFNQIFRAPEGRSWVRRLTEYWTLLSLGPLLLVATFAVSETARQKIGSWTSQMNLGDLGINPIAVTAFLITVLISTSLLFILYTAVPNTRVRVWPALVGAFASAVLWEAAKWGFTQFVVYSASYAKFYGTLALLPMFMLWIYITWFIILLGLVLAYSIQNYKQIASLAGASGLLFSGPAFLRAVDEELARDGAGRVVDPSSILLVACCVAERFAKGDKTTLSTIVSRTALPEPAVRRMLESLAAAGFVAAVADKNGSADKTSYTLARPADTIRAADVLRLTRRSAVRAGDASLDPASRVLEDLDDQRLRAAEGKSLADLIGAPAKPPAPASPIPAA